MFDVLETRRCGDIEGIVSPERGSKGFGTFDRQAPGLQIPVSAFKIATQRFC